MSQFDNGLMWFRRDLRASDNAALHHALRSCRKVWCVFVFDRDILDPLPRADRRVEFIRESLVELDTALRELGAAHGHASTGLIVLHDHARHAIPALAARLGVQAVFTNHDDEPDALARDARVFGVLAHQGVLMRSFKDHVVFERREVLTQAGHAFGVFTPYKNAWLKALTPDHLKACPIEPHAGALAPLPPRRQTSTGPCRRWPTSASRRRTWPACPCPPAPAVHNACSTISCSASTVTRRRAISLQ